MGVEPRGASSDVASTTVVQFSLPTGRPNVAGSYFTYPDGSHGAHQFDANDIIDALWVTNTTGYSVQINCTLPATAEYSTFSIDQAQAINDGSKYSLRHVLPQTSLDFHLGG